MRIAGHTLLWIGFVGAAFASLYRLEQADRWTTVPWIGYAVAMATGCVGVVLIRMARRQHESDHSKTDSEYSLLCESLERVTAVIQRLNGSIDLGPGEVLRSIDDECADALSDFADARQSLVKRFGMNVYADVMTEFAAGERYINRAWSAAADGYVDEVASSLSRASQHLHNAKSLMNRAESPTEAAT